MVNTGDVILWKKHRAETFTHIGIAVTPFKIRSFLGEQQYPIATYDYNIIAMNLDARQSKHMLELVPAATNAISVDGTNTFENDWIFVQFIIQEILHIQVNQWQELLLMQDCSCTHDETIFVSVPSYRDPQCFDTIKSLWTNATQPKNIYVGVCQQNSDMDEDVGNKVRMMFPSLYDNNFFILRVDADEATGPCMARELIENFLYDDQDFVLMIDSHTTFRNNWDTRLLDEWRRTKDPCAILTTYPNQYGGGNKWSSQQPTFLKAKKWSFVKFPLYIQGRFKEQPGKPVPAIVIAAGFCFLPRHAVDKAPYVTDVPFSFIGEETVMAIKYFTHGFNIYSPTENIVETSFRRSERPNFTEIVRTQKDDIREESNRRLLDIACGRLSSEVGEERLVEDYYAYSGMDIRNGSLNSLSQHGVTARDTPSDAFSKWGDSMKNIYKNMIICRRG